MKLSNHEAPRLSDLEKQMAAFVPEGGNWTHIPDGFSERVDQIRRRSKERGLIHTTYYGRLAWDHPAYTVNTYFSRMGNGCFLHPDQQRLISLREGARLQSFPDFVEFGGSKRSQYMQIGNAVPPVLAAAVANTFEPGNVVDLFCGAGGMSLGFAAAGHSVAFAVDHNLDACETLSRSHPGLHATVADLSRPDVVEDVAAEILAATGGEVDTIVAGPPCQGFSTAGKRGVGDPRSELLWVPFELARIVRPRRMVIENVQGILSMAGRKIPGWIEDRFRSLGMKSTYAVLRAERFGVPQRRTRVFFVGDAAGNDWHPPEATRSAVGSEELLLPPPVSVREAISDLPPIEAGGKSESYEESDALSEFADLSRLDSEMWVDSHRSILAVG